MYSLLMLAIEDFAEILRAKRARGESRVNIGKHLGVSHESVRLWETGKRPAKSVLLLAERLWVWSGDCPEYDEIVRKRP